jgi:uncharacterized protein with HEPN domain
MQDAIGRIEEFVQGMDLDAFMSDRRTSDAVVRNLEIIGEAARNVPDSITERFPEIRWKKAREMRNVLVHAYFGVDLPTVWRTIHDDLPPLKAQLSVVLQDRETNP